MGVLTIVERIFRERKGFFAEIKSNHQVGQKLAQMGIVATACLVLYGLVLGISHGIVQSLASAVKLPLLYGLTLLLSLPAFYFFTLLAGSRLTFGQTLSLLLTGATVAAVLSLSLAPISAFFWISASDYLLFKLLNVGFMALAGALGVVFLFQGSELVQGEVARRTRLALLWSWAVVFALVGTQLAWTLRPFFGSPLHSFQWFRGVGGTFFGDLAHSLVALLVSLLRPS